MTFRPIHLLVCCIAVSAGCGLLLEDFSGVLCNEDGSCPQGYFCKADTGRCEPGQAPVQEDAGVVETPDAGVCASVSACVADDGCCPSGCHANNDPECSPVCGNGQVEAMGDEVCDDGNTLNGDNCDPTCRYFNGVALVSGEPGSRGFADGPRGNVARFQSPGQLTTGEGAVFLADFDSATVRRIQLSDGTITTVAGVPFEKELNDGPVAAARFVQPEDAVYLDGVLYLRDRMPSSDGGTPGQLLRRITLDGGLVETVDAGMDFTNLRALGRDTQALLLIDDNGLRRWTPSSGAVETLATNTQLTALAGSSLCEGVTASQFGTYPYYVACRRTLLRVPSAGTVELHAGSSTTSGCSDADGGTAAASFVRARSLAWGASRPSLTFPLTYQLIVADPGCQTLRTISSSGTAISTYAGSPYAIGAIDATDRLSARFNQPSSVAAISAGLKSPPTLYVSDTNNGTVRGMQTGVSTVAGAVASTSVSYGDAGTDSLYVQVNDVAVDGDAGVAYATSQYIAGGKTGRVLRLSLDTGASEELMTFSPQKPTALAVLDGTLYVAMADGTIHRFTPGAAATELYAGQAGQTAPAVDGDRGTAILSASALLSHGGALFFVDDKARSIRKLDPTTGFVTTLAGSTSTEGGSPGIVDGTGRAAGFDSPRDLASDGTHLYTLDGNGSVVRRISLPLGEVTTLAGQPLSLGALDGVGSAARFAGARGLTSDGRSLFIADPGGGPTVSDLSGPTIRALDLRTSAVTTMVGTRGQWTAMAGTGSGARVNAPGPMAFDPVRQWIVFYDDRENVFLRIR